MKRKIGSAICVVVSLAIMLSFGLLVGFTAGVSENKNEFFSLACEKVAPLSNSRLFAHLVGDNQEHGEKIFNTLFGELFLNEGESFENASFYSADLSRSFKSEKPVAVSSNERVASVNLGESDELSVALSIRALSPGNAEIYLVDSSGKAVSESISVCVGNAVSQTETADEEIFTQKLAEKTTEKSTEETTEKQTEESTTEKEAKPPVKAVLNAEKTELKLTAGDKNKSVVFRSDSKKVDLKNAELECVSSDEKIARVKIKNIGANSVELVITAVSAGKAVVRVKSNDEAITDGKLTVKVSEPETTEKVTENKAAHTEPKQTTTQKHSTTEKATQSEKVEETGDIVYRTPSGSCYHRKSCRYIKDNASSLTVAQAKRIGLRACKVCKP